RRPHREPGPGDARLYQQAAAYLRQAGRLFGHVPGLLRPGARTDESHDQGGGGPRGGIGRRAGGGRGRPCRSQRRAAVRDALRGLSPADRPGAVEHLPVARGQRGGQRRRSDRAPAHRAVRAAGQDHRRRGLSGADAALRRHPRRRGDRGDRQPRARFLGQPRRPGHAGAGGRGARRGQVREAAMASLTLYPEEERLQGKERLAFNFYMISPVGLLVLVMLLGVAMRMAQARWVGVPPDWFYKPVSVHGAGMVGTVGMATMGVMWYFLRKCVRLHLWAFVTNYVMFLAGALCIIASIFLGDYAGLWTSLYPLPTHGMGLWNSNAAALFMTGYLFIGVGALLFYFDAAAGIIRVHGNLGRALGLQWLFGGTIDPDHPKTVVASTMVIISNSIGIIVGAVVLVMGLVNIYYPQFTLDALLAKNLIYWFGHMYINAAIYMAVIVVYELLPRYTRKPYPISCPFLWSWAVSTVFVIVVFPHHLLMDYAQPRWLSIMGQVVSWGAGFPVLLVTAYGALANLYQSNIRWNMPSRLMILSVFGWAAGIVPAI